MSCSFWMARKRKAAGKQKEQTSTPVNCEEPKIKSKKRGAK